MPDSNFLAMEACFLDPDYNPYDQGAEEDYIKGDEEYDYFIDG